MRPSEQLVVAHYIACYVDILGQRDKLRGWKSLPANENERHAFIKSMKETAGTVMQFRQAFRDYFHSFSQAQERTESPHLSKEQMRRVAIHREFNLKTYHFSDFHLFVHPLCNSDGHLTVEPIFRILSACAMAMILSLAGKAPVRGGISIGPMLLLPEGDHYGPAMNEAFCLEHDIAQLPRVLVSEELVTFLREPTGFCADPLDDRIAKAMAEQCRKLLCDTDDSRTMIDFLGASAHDQAPSDFPETVVRPAYLFARNERDRFASAGDTKHAPRYARLVSYIESRLPLWGMSA